MTLETGYEASLRRYLESEPDSLARMLGAERDVGDPEDDESDEEHEGDRAEPVGMGRAD